MLGLCLSMSACWRSPDEASIEVLTYQPSLHDFRKLWRLCDNELGKAASVCA